MYARLSIPPLSIEMGPATTAPRQREDAGGLWPRLFCVLERHNGNWTMTHQLPVEAVRAEHARAGRFIDAIDAELGRTLARPSARAQRDVLIEIPMVATDGFDIDVHIDGGRLCASFGGLNQEFADFSTLMLWLRRALSNHYRLKISSCGSLPFEWRLERADGDTGIDEVLVGGRPLWFRKWRAVRHTIRRNRLLDPPAREPRLAAARLPAASVLGGIRPVLQDEPIQRPLRIARASLTSPM